MKGFFILAIFLCSFFSISVYGADPPEYSGIENPSYYQLDIDDDIFLIPYETNGDVIAMAIDPELTSLLIGLENTKDSIFVIDLDFRIISAENNEFAILINGLEIDYDIVPDSNSSTISFFMPEFTEEVEIIGTKVIPEFPFGIIFGVISIMTLGLILSRTKVSLFRW